MKTIILLVALVLSTGAFAQGNSEVKKAEKQIKTSQSEAKEQTEKVQKEVKEKAEQQKESMGKPNGNKAENEKKDAKEKGEKANNGNAYGKDKQGLTGKEFGQHRAAEAKAKAAAVKTNDDADAMIRMSKEDTKETLKSIDEKMTEARQLLMDKLASKEITKAQFDEKLKKLMEIEKRKSAIVKEID